MAGASNGRESFLQQDFYHNFVSNQRSGVESRESPKFSQLRQENLPFLVLKTTSTPKQRFRSQRPTIDAIHCIEKRTAQSRTLSICATATSPHRVVIKVLPRSKPYKIWLWGEVFGIISNCTLADLVICCTEVRAQ